MPERRYAYQRYYDVFGSRIYDTMMRVLMLAFGGEEQFRREMTAAIHLGEADRILELCCGTGGATGHLRLRAGPVPRIVGLDLSIGQLRRAQAKEIPEVPLLQADAATIPFPDASFDTVVIPHALHEMPRETRRDVIREAKRVLDPNGQIYVLELDDPPSLRRRLLLGLWLGYWLPGFINFENATRRDMLRRGLENELREFGFANTEKLTMFDGAMQVVLAWD
jgi:demethylmenaquinone methyltransferase/2-methoxy-6-polyprenyl-1,4-benzoquinol methylase